MPQRTAFAAIDVGSTKIATVVGDADDRGGLRVLGVGVSPSAGIDKGKVSNIGQAVEAIRAAVDKAERSSGTRILSAGVSLSGAHLASTNNRGIVAIPDATLPISPDDIQRVLDAARTISLKSNRELLHAVPRYFVVDGQDRVSDPEGMHGQRLDVEMHLVTAAVNATQNVIKCVEGAGVQVDALAAAPVVAAAAALQDDERLEGAVLVDLGGGTTDVAVYEEGAVVHTASLPVGGAHITRDLVVGLRCAFAVAEEIKTSHGHAQPHAVDPAETVELTTFGQEATRETPRRLLAEIMQARLEEIIAMIMVEVKRTGHVDTVSAGLVFSGGSAQTPGLCALAEELTGLPARVGAVEEISGLVDQVAGPGYVTTLGLLQWMGNEHVESETMRLRMPKAPGLLNLVRGVGRLGRVFLPQ